MRSIPWALWLLVISPQSLRQAIDVLVVDYLVQTGHPFSFSLNEILLFHGRLKLNADNRIIVSFTGEPLFLLVRAVL